MTKGMLPEVQVAEKGYLRKFESAMLSDKF